MVYLASSRVLDKTDLEQITLPFNLSILRWYKRLTLNYNKVHQMGIFLCGRTQLFL
jgi:hypothetical protein